jgi:Rrf2 family nitric oxide-sensitive transcriptional repressor
MEPDLDIVPCFNASSACIIEPACILKGALDEALDAFLDVLDHYTLADLVTPRRKLAALLKAKPRPL